MKDVFTHLRCCDTQLYDVCDTPTFATRVSIILEPRKKELKPTTGIDATKQKLVLTINEKKKQSRMESTKNGKETTPKR